jgi:hypothetical protein
MEFQGEDGVLGSQGAKPREVVGTETLEDERDFHD